MELLKNEKNKELENINKGIKRGEALVVPYDPEWKQQFEIEKARLHSSLGENVRIEHIGSTSISELSAKPIIDMAIIVKESDFSKIPDLLVKLGYLDRGTPFSSDNHIFIYILPNNTQTHKIHLIPNNSNEWKKMLFFRDALLSSSELCSNYEALKLELALKFPKDRPSYRKHKDKFIEKLLEDNGF